MVITVTSDLTSEKLTTAYEKMCLTRALFDEFERDNYDQAQAFFPSKGHEGFQTALGMQLTERDIFIPSVRDFGVFMGMGIDPSSVAAQVYGTTISPFSSSVSAPLLTQLKAKGFPYAPPQGFTMKGRPAEALGIAMAIKKRMGNTSSFAGGAVICSLSESSDSAGGFYEAAQFAAKHQLPILFLVQDNEWSGGSPWEEVRNTDTMYATRGFRGLYRNDIHGGDFVQSYDGVYEALEFVRKEQLPMLLIAKCPLIGDYSSQISATQYRSTEDIESHRESDPLLRMEKYLKIEGLDGEQAERIKLDTAEKAKEVIQAAKAAAGEEALPEPPSLEQVQADEFPSGINSLPYKELFGRAVNQLLEKGNSLYFGENISRPMGGTFMQSDTIGLDSSDDRVINIPYNNKLLSGLSTGFALMGGFPIVEMDADSFADQGLELAKRSAELVASGVGQVRALVRIMVGQNQGFGPGSKHFAENVLVSIPHTITVAPSNATMAYGYAIAATHAPLPVFLLEDHLLRESEEGMGVEVSEDFALTFGKGRTVATASKEAEENGESLAIATYGLGVYLSIKANEALENPAEIIDLGSLQPVDSELVLDGLTRHNKLLIVSPAIAEEGFAQVLAGKITSLAYTKMDGPIKVVGAGNSFGVPLGKNAQQLTELSVDKIKAAIQELLSF